MNVLLSIVVPCYKVEKYIEKCINSVLEQNFDDYELILVDDGSPDNSAKIIDKYAKKSPKIKAIHKKNGGLVSARNEGLKKAKGQYILALDGDDFIKEGALKKISDIIKSNDYPDVIITNMIKVFKGREETIQSLVKEKLYLKAELEKDIYPYMMYDKRKPFYKGLVFPSAGGKIIKTKILKNHFCKDNRIKMGEDNAYLFECVFYADSVYFSDYNYYMYNQTNDGSIVKNYDKKRFHNNKLLTNYIESNLLGKKDYLDFEINAFKAYWLIMAIFHEVKCKRNIFASRKHLKEVFKELKPLDDINIKPLPKTAKMFLVLLKMHLYLSSLLGAYIINKLRK